MKGLVIFVALVSVAWATPLTLKSYCTSLSEELCDHYPRDEVCDTAGTVYRNKCKFLASWCKNSNLTLTACEPEKELHKSYICKFYEKEDCSRYFSTWKNKCDKKGNKYRNSCEYYQAWCEYKTIELVTCPKEPVHEVVKTTPKPLILPNVLFCEFYVQNNCTLKKFGRVDVCDQNGNLYRNKCEFRKAWCDNTTLEANDCLEHSGDEDGSGEESREVTGFESSEETSDEVLDKDYEYDPSKDEKTVKDKYEKYSKYEKPIKDHVKSKYGHKKHHKKDSIW